MTLLTERFPSVTPQSVSCEGSAHHYAVAPLDPFLHQEPRWCANCGGEQMFFPCFEFAGGRVGVCFGCGDERVVPFSRATEVS